MKLSRVRRTAAVSMLLASLALAIGCGIGGADLGVGLKNSTTGELAGPNGAIGLTLAPYEILDLASGRATTSTSVNDLLTNPAYLSTSIVFKRVHGLGEDYFLSVYPVTQGQWKQLSAGSTPWSTIKPAIVPATVGSAADRLPAFNISYSSLVNTLSIYNLTARSQLEIPTIRQWQFACAGGTSTTWFWGESRDPTVIGTYAATYESQTPLLGSSLAQRGPEPVGTHRPNPLGFYDMLGNVWQWVAPGPHMCGGSWHDSVEQAKTLNVEGSGDASVITSVSSHALIGVRLVLSP
jgi:hypothetical protein